jgi:probable HAF family extracellular repeat protein
MTYRQILVWALGSLSSAALAQPPAAPQAAGWSHYRVIELGQVDPWPPGEPNFIANTSLVAGAAPVTGGATHAVVWFGGLPAMDIGATQLGGPNSEAFGINDRGQVVGAGQTSDSNNEDFCGFNSMRLAVSATACHAFIWQNEGITELPNKLGGANSVANLINNQGDVAGFAETSQSEKGCPVNRFVPVVWRKGALQELSTSAADPDGVAAGINDKGQAVGASGVCAPFNPNSGYYLLESHAMFWDTDGTPHQLPTFGGDGGFGGNHACNLNNRGQVVGHSDLTGDTGFQGFIWTLGDSTLTPLKPFLEDAYSVANNINDGGDVVGASINVDFSSFRAVLWRNGQMADLNELAPDSPMSLMVAFSINASGEIVGVGQEGDEIHGFLAIPDSPASAQDVPLLSTHRAPPVISENGRRLLFRRFGIRKR